MNIAVKARVVLADGVCGEITHWVIDPLARRVTHLVVRVKGAHAVERLVSVGGVAEVAPGEIRLHYKMGDLESMAPFTVIEWLPAGQGRFGPLLDRCLVHKLLFQPFVNLVKRADVPPEQVAVRAGLRVETVDGCIGSAEGLEVDPLDWRVSYLAVRSGPLWSPKMVTVPLAQIDRIGGMAVTTVSGPGNAPRELGARQTAL